MTAGITTLPVGAAVPLAVLHAACFPEDPWDAAALERILTLSGAFGYLAWDNDDPVGFALVRDLGGEIEILSVGVLPECRQRGIGRALLDAVCGGAQERGAASIVLEVAADNVAAQCLYNGMGFVRAGRRPRYYRRSGAEAADALIMRRGFIVKAGAP